MSFGFTPKHIEEYTLNDLTKEAFLVIAIEAANIKGWEIGHLSNNGFIAYTKAGMFSWNAEIKVTIDNGLATLQSSSLGNEMMDWGKNKKCISKFIDTLNEEKDKLSQEEIDLKYEALKTTMVRDEEDTLLAPAPTTKENFLNFFSIFKPTQGYFITPVLINLNILLFVIMALLGANIFMPDNEILLKWGANFRPMTLEGQWWRLLTNCFLHIGIFHLLMNMYALMYIGMLLEPLLGKSRFITAYLLTGIAASLTSLWWHDLTISAGASGAIFGMYGVFLSLLTTNLIEKNARKALLASIGVFVGYNLLNGLKGGIDNAAHIGGLVSGLVIGYAFIPSLQKEASPKRKYLTIGILSVLVLGASVLVYHKMPNDIAAYDRKMQTFMTQEKMALTVFDMPENTPNDTLQKKLQQGIVYWNKNIALLDETTQLDLPDQLKSRIEKLRLYCKIRIKSYETINLSINDQSDLHKTQIENYNKEMELIITDLSGKNSSE